MNNMTQNKMRTAAIHVVVTTEDYEIDGYMHIKPGSYQQRISDLLNIKELRYIPITKASFRSLSRPAEEPRVAETLIVRLDSIKMVAPLEQEVKPAAGDASAAALAANIGSGGLL